MNLQWLVWVIYLIVMVFQLRLLMHKASVDLFNPLAQAVLKITNPVMNLPFLKSIGIGSGYNRLPLGGIVFAFVVALVFWILMFGSHIGLAIMITVMTLIKCFGYLIMFLMIAQALTSWLPSTQHWSMLFGAINEPIIGPVRKIVPPIGMIDLSLMVVMFLLWALNALIAHVLFAVSVPLGQMWVFL